METIVGGRDQRPSVGRRVFDVPNSSSPHPSGGPSYVVAKVRHDYDVGMRLIGRVLQILGLILLPLALILQLFKDFGFPFTVRDMLLTLIFGAAIFYLGRLLEGYARR